MLKRSVLISLITLLPLLGQETGELAPYIVRIWESGAIGDGRTDDLRAIQKAIDDSPVRSIIDFGSDRIYQVSGTLRLLPNRTYRGSSTLAMAEFAAIGTPLLRLDGSDSHDVVLDGLALDARHIGGILHLAVGSTAAVPARNIVIRNTTFLRSGRLGQVSDSSIFTPVGLQSSLITANRFVDCSTCIHLANPNEVAISNNEFNGSGGNAISIVTYNSSFDYGRGIEITGNRGRNLRRMAIELVGGEAHTRMEAPLIADNVFTDWSDRLAPDAFGISVAVGTNAKILRNTLSGLHVGYGIEVGSSGAHVEGNDIKGFYYGIILQGQPDLLVTNNVLSDQISAGIMFSNSGSNPRAAVTWNRIYNPREFGIGMVPNDYSDALIADNTIEREGGQFSGDVSGHSFVGIKLDTGAAGPVALVNNHIIQTGMAPPDKLSFVGVGFYAGLSKTAYRNNIVESLSHRPYGMGFLFFFGQNADEANVSENQFINLNRVSNGLTPRVLIQKQRTGAPTGVPIERKRKI